MSFCWMWMSSLLYYQASQKNQVKPKGSPTPAAVVFRENVVGTSLRIITMMMKFIFNLGLPLGKTKLEWLSVESL